MGVRTDRDGDVVHLVLDHPEHGNALDHDTALALRDAAAAVVADDTVRVVVLRGDGPRFCVGGDLRSFVAAGPDTRVAETVAHAVHEALELLRAARQPVVCVVGGAVGGGGVGLLLAADVVLLAEGAVLRLGYTAVGLAPDCGVTWELPRRVGQARAMDLVLTNRRVDAGEALAMGLASRVVPAEELDAALDDVLSAVLAAPPEGLAEAKRLLRAGDSGLHARLDDEARTIGRLGDTPAARDAIAGFLGGR